MMLHKGNITEARAALLKVAHAHRGNVVHMAPALGITRRHLYRQLESAKLWPEIEALRKRPAWLAKTLEELC